MLRAVLLNVVAVGVTPPPVFVNSGPTVKEYAPSVTGSLDKDLLRKIVKRNIGQVRSCYERELQKNPNLTGKVEVKFVITPEGHVASSTIGSSTIANAEVEACVAGRVRTWPFPTATGTVQVSYPFTFQPGP